MIHVVHVITRMNVGGPSVMLVDLLRGLDPTRYKHTIIRGAVVDAEGDYLADRTISPLKDWLVHWLIDWWAD